MNNPCIFYIVRHGRTEANKNNVVSGQKETALTAEGREEALIRAQELKDISFSAVFSSDLLRAKETAEIIAAKHSLAVQTSKLLRERNYGEFEGKNRNMISKELQEKLDAYNKLNYTERLKEKWARGMESDEELLRRFITLLRETALAYAGKNVLIVTHGNIMRTLLVSLGFGTHQELSHGTAKNTAYFVLKSDGVEFEVVKTVGIEKK